MAVEEHAGFLQWLSKAGGLLHDQLDAFADTGPTGRGVLARASIGQQEQLAKIPLDCCLHIRHKECMEIWNIIQASHSRVSFFVGTVLALMREICKGPASLFLPYLRILPKEYDCVLAWTPAEAEELAGTSIHSAAVKGSEEVFEAEAWPMLQQHPALWPYPTRQAALKDFQDCAGMVQTRSFHLAKIDHAKGTSEEGEELYLIPGIDMMNHSCLPEECNTSLQRTGPAGCVPVAAAPPPAPGQAASASPAVPCFVMHAEKAIASGGEILHSYGRLSNAQLLLTYGFVPVLPEGVSNPNDRLPIPVADIISCCERPAAQAAAAGKGKGKAAAADKISQLRMMLLEELGLRHDDVQLTAAAPLPDQLITIAQVMHMDLKELQSLHKRSKGTKRQKLDSPAPGPEMDADSPAAMLACQSALRLLHGRLKAFPDTSEAKAAGAVALHRQAAARSICSWEQHTLEIAKLEVLALIMQDGDDEDDDSDMDSESGSDDESQ